MLYKKKITSFFIIFLFCFSVVFGQSDNEVMTLEQIDSLIESKDFTSALRELSLYIKVYPNQFDKAQKRISKVMQHREYYNLRAFALSDLMRQSEDVDNVDDINQNELDNKKMEIITSSGKEIIDSNIRYFELTIKGYTIISIGLIDLNTYKYQDTMIGMKNGSIGFHSNGYVYNGNDYSETFLKKYNLNENEIHTIGCGYNIKKYFAFFTIDGIKLDKIFKLNWIGISAAFSIQRFDSIEINYGDEKPFKFNLLEEYLKNK